jgi:hypothetical protein
VEKLKMVELNIENEQDADDDYDSDETAGNPVNRFFVDLLFFFA